MALVTDSTTIYTLDFRVGDWWVRPTLNRLEWGDERIQLEPKSMEVLVDLAEHAGEVRSKRRLLQAVWQNAFVSDDVLTHAIWELRRALGDDPKAPAYIRTIPRKGYMLVAEVARPGVSEPPTDQFPYRLGEKLAAGAIGEVFKAEDPRLRRTVALKLLPRELAADQAAKERFLREARAAAALDHPHIGVIYDVGESPEGRPFIAMAYYSGQSLKEKLADGPLPVETAIELARQIAEGLAAAHAAGLVHCDIKPANVMLTEDGSSHKLRAKVVDFGLARGIGDTALRSLGSTVGTALYMSPEQARGDRVDPRSDIWSLGVTLYEMASGHRAFDGSDVQAVRHAVLHEVPMRLSSVVSELPRGLETIVDQCLQKEPGSRYQQASTLAEDLATILAGRQPIAGLGEAANPYPGLAPFTEEHAAFFFGREREIADFWARVREQNLLALIGPSGAGKTSFIRAGLVPARPAGWRCLVAKPGPAPFISLGQSLAPQLRGDPESLRELVRFAELESAVSILTRWRRAADEALLVVDQFEELFTLTPPEVGAAFAELLGRLVGDAGLHVLLSLRDDFLIHCHEHPALAQVFRQLTPLTPLRGTALRRAVTAPAEAIGYAFEDEALVDEMLAEVEDERGALPLVAFTAAQLWERRDLDSRLLTRRVYVEIGGVGGALAQHADATLELIGTERRPIVREIFRNLVTAQGTRAARDREELLSVFTDPGPFDPVGSAPHGPRWPQDRRPSQPAGDRSRKTAAEILDALIDARLLTSYEVAPVEGEEDGHHRIEIIHESLLSHWPRLVRWRTQDQDSSQLRDEFRQAAHLWDQHGRADDFLWNGIAYREFKLWRERYPGNLSELEEAFARQMIRHTQRRKRRRTQTLAATFLLLLAALVAIGVSRQQAVTGARRAEAAKLVALAQVELESDPTEALAYATASLALADSNEARLFALTALAEAPPAREIAIDDYSDAAPLGLQVPAFSPGGELVAVTGYTDKGRIWPATGGEPVVLTGLHASQYNANFGRWSGNGYLLTRHYTERALRVWAEGNVIRTIDPGGPVAMDQVGEQHLFTEQETPDSTPERPVFRLRAWLLPDGNPEELGVVAWPDGASSSMFDPLGTGWIYTKGKRVFFRPLPASASAPDRVLATHRGDEIGLGRGLQPDYFWSRDKTGEFRIWEPTPSAPRVRELLPKPETMPNDLVTSVFPTPSGELAHVGTSLRVWSLQKLPRARPQHLRRAGSWKFVQADFHPNGRWAAAITRGLSAVTFWPLPESSPSIVDGYTGLRTPVAFSADGRWLATGWESKPDFRKEVWIWPLPGNESREVRRIELPSRETRVLNLAFDPKGRYLFVTGWPLGSVYFISLSGDEIRHVDINTGDAYMNSIAVSPSGNRVATAWTAGEHGAKELRYWDWPFDDSRAIPLPDPTSRPEGASTPACEDTQWGGHGISTLDFEDETTLWSGGAHGVLKWNLDSETFERVHQSAAGGGAYLAFDRNTGNALVAEPSIEGECECRLPKILDLKTGDIQPLEGHEKCMYTMAYGSFDLVAGIAATGHTDGTIRVGRLDGSPAHLLIGHEKPVSSLAISPDLRWIASSGDETLRLWPMPDLDAAPLQSLPHDELLAELHSLTNLRAVRDETSSTGWSIEVGPFPGWEEVPTW